MRTIWTGSELIIRFDNTRRDVSLNIEQAKEFEEWVLVRVRNGL